MIYEDRDWPIYLKEYERNLQLRDFIDDALYSSDEKGLQLYSAKGFAECLVNRFYKNQADFENNVKYWKNKIHRYISISNPQKINDEDWNMIFEIIHEYA